MTEIHETLKRVPLFRDLDEAGLTRLERMARERSFNTGDVIVRQGDEGTGVYVILDGRVQVERDGRELASLGSGYVFGEMALLDNYRRSATVKASEATRVLVIPRSDFLAELHGNNQLCFDLLVHMSRRVRDLEQALSAE